MNTTARFSSKHHTDDVRVRLKRLERAHRVAVARRRAAFALLGTFVLGIPLSSDALDIPNRFEAGEPVLAESFNANFDAIREAFDARVIRDDVIFPVTSADGCSGLIATLASLDEYRVAASGSITVSLALGNYACEETIRIESDNASHLTIRGEGNNPAQVTLSFPAGSDGIAVEGQVLERIENLTLEGGGDGQGVRVGRGSALRNLSDTELRGWATGVEVVVGSSVTSEEGLVLESNVAYGVRCQRGSDCYLLGAIASGGGTGFAALSGSAVTVSNCTAVDNVYGFAAYSGAFLRVTDGSVAQGNEIGFRSDRSLIHVGSSTSADANGIGYQVIAGGRISGEGALLGAGNGALTNIPINQPDPITLGVIND